MHTLLGSERPAESEAQEIQKAKNTIR